MRSTPGIFGRESNSAKTPAAHLVVPAGSHVLVLPTAAGPDHGQILPTDPAVGGMNDAFTLWLQR